MKLRLPHRFHAALLAAIASVSFTTLSTGTIGAAVFALAGYQAAGEETETATAASGQQDLSGDYEAAKEAADRELTKAAGPTDEEREAEDKLKEELEDNARMVEEKEEEQKRETTTDPLDEEAMERTLDSINSSGGGSGSLLSMLGSAPAETETAAPVAAPAQQAAPADSGVLPSNDLGFTSNPYATASSGASEPVFQMPAAAPQAQSVETPALQTAAAPAATASPAGTVPSPGFNTNGWDTFPSLQRGYLATTILTASDNPQEPTNLVWEGDEESKGTWQNGGDDQDSPWRFTPQASAPEPKAFHNGDIALFEKSAVVTVQGTVQTSSLQIAEGEPANQIEVTIITPEKNTTLTADHVVSLGLYVEGKPYTNKIVKQGDGAVVFNVDDPNFKTQLEIQGGAATINFNQLSSQNYFLYTSLEAAEGTDVTLNFKGAGTSSKTIAFQKSSLLKGIDEYNVEDGLTLEINSAWGEGSGFYLDKDAITINLGSGSILNSLASTEEVKAKSLTIKGTGENISDAFFHNMFLSHGEDLAVHNLSGSVYTQITSLTIDENSTHTIMQIDDASTLHIENMYTGNNLNESFLHAFKNDGTETNRQKVTIDTLNTYSGATIHLGAASTDQGASEGYQEAGTVKVGDINGNGTVVLENNAVVTYDGQCLTEVFDIEESHMTSKDFGGTLCLAATNDGTANQRKKAVALFRSLYTVHNDDAELKLEANADYTDYMFVINQAAGLSTNGISDVVGVKSNSTAMIYSGSIGEEKNAGVNIDGKQRTLQLYAAPGKNYESSFGISSGIDIDFSGAGSQTFKGNFSDFKGDITVGGTTQSGSTLSIIEQGTALKIENLLLRPEATLNVKDTESKNQLAKVSGVLTAEGYGAGGGTDYGSSVVNANLQMEQGSVYDVSEARGTGGLNLTGSLTFEPGAQLSSADMQAIKEYLVVNDGTNSMYDLAFNVTSFNGKTEAIDWDSPNAIDASTIFTGQFWKGEYYICFSGTGKDGGYGNNVGTVYLYYALPEPTTGTLSLLALAALAARRRRK